MANEAQASLDDVNSAIESAAVELEFRDRRVRYRPLDELVRARDILERDCGLKP